MTRHCPTLREVKHARTKLDIANAFVRRLRTSRYEEISIRELCRSVEISEGRFGGMKINKLVFSQLLGAAIIGYVLALPLLYRWRPEVVRICSAFAIPVPRTRHMLVIGAIVLLICGAVSSSKRGELTEFGLSWMMVLCVMFPRNAADFQVAPPRAGAGGIP